MTFLFRVIHSFMFYESYYLLHLHILMLLSNIFIHVNLVYIKLLANRAKIIKSAIQHDMHVDNWHRHISEFTALEST